MEEILPPQKIISEAQAAYQNGDYLNAANKFMAASNSYGEIGEEMLASEMANNACVAYLQADEALKALRLIEGKEEVFEQMGDIRRKAITLGNRAAALEALGRNQEALRDYASSADLFKSIGDDELFTTTMQALSALQLRSGRSLEAVATMQAGVNKIHKPGIKQRILKKLLNFPLKLISRG